MLLKINEAPDKQTLEVQEHLALLTAKYFHILSSQLKRSCFEPNSTRTILEEESKINVDEMTSAIK